MSEATAPIRIDFVSDVSCPWCAIGLAGLDHALEALPQADRSRWVTPAKIASLIRWLTSDAARVVTGNVILAGR